MWLTTTRAVADGKNGPCSTRLPVSTLFYNVALQVCPGGRGIYSLMPGTLVALCRGTSLRLMLRVLLLKYSPVSPQEDASYMAQSVLLSLSKASRPFQASVT